MKVIIDRQKEKMMTKTYEKQLEALRPQYASSYVMQSAVRGCDIVDSSVLTLIGKKVIGKKSIKRSRLLDAVNRTKRALTGRIRAICYTDTDCLGIWKNERITTEEQLQAIRSDIAVLRSYGVVFHHYLDHLQEAIKESDDHPIWGKKEWANEIIQALNYIKYP